MARLALACLLLALCHNSAEAHGRRLPALNASGLEIPSSGHGELIALSRHYGDIIALADRHNTTDPKFRKLSNYARIQRYYCFWGMAPYSASDEESPFNECSHAYLSAAKQLLLYMRDMPAVAPDANALTSKIDAEMVQEGLAFIGCQYSGEVFFTSEFLTPHWELLPKHPPSLIAASVPVVLLAGGSLALRQRKRTRHS
ncbi:hypothetical protein FPY71_07475 [Aureimonas fodinaquatilis]|uniref:VPLPA-CTERM sorting domain-containing protein n=1 Tax=Aureimonas fodinaquatilis TaxID=2565783 RepID=A0A5B0DUA9_9HYPH|nr:hypothetical protein [Aureimonas fodinaquatilis]KAA0970354.1 hypothetical protein FPY71_07475 [Aureimonas fodinaquatilis]